MYLGHCPTTIADITQRWHCRQIQSWPSECTLYTQSVDNVWVVLRRATMYGWWRWLPLACRFATVLLLSPDVFLVVSRGSHVVVLQKSTDGARRPRTLAGRTVVRLRQHWTAPCTGGGVRLNVAVTDHMPTRRGTIDRGVQLLSRAGQRYRFIVQPRLSALTRQRMQRTGVARQVFQQHRRAIGTQQRFLGVVALARTTLFLVYRQRWSVQSVTRTTRA